jgi:hypothetical protein
VRREPGGLSRWGGISLIGSGILMLARHLLELCAGPLPARGAEILALVEAGRLPLMLASQVLYPAWFMGVGWQLRRLAIYDGACLARASLPAGGPAGTTSSPPWSR